MRITYDDAFDSGSWPGPGGGNAVAGELWVGLSGLLGVLEGLTGLARNWPSHAHRVASLIPLLSKTKGFWDASALTDALSSAERLLELRDALVLHGWSGGVASPRVKQLEMLALQLEGSPGDRLASLTATLSEFPKLVDDFTLISPRNTLPRRVQDCLAALEAKGTCVVEEPLASAKAPSKSDLARAKAHTAFTPARDASLQLIQPYAPQLAAEAIAAALAADRETSTLIIGADAVLDHALTRHGLPTVGGAGDPSDNAVLQLLPLVVAMGARPQDPERVVELLTLPVSPVPRGVARRLVRALQNWPAVGSPDWDAALADGLATIDDVTEREKVAVRLRALFNGQVPSSTWNVAELFARSELLRAWLFGREHNETDDDARARFSAAIGQCVEFEALLRASALARVSTAQLKLFLERATAAADGSQRYAARAGLRSVGKPGGVAGPIDRIVWWNFTLAAAVSPHGSIWSKAELNALAAAGVCLPSTGDRARALSQQFLRPLSQATRELWLVCPERGADGTESAPHPLWDEVLGFLGSGGHARALTFEAPQVKTPLLVKKREPLSLPMARPVWMTKAKLRKREEESASSVDALLGCAFHWALNYVGKLRPGQTAELPGDQQLLGNLAHEVVGKTIEAKPKSPAAAAADAEQRFNDMGPTHAAPLFLPGHDAERAEALQAARSAAKQLATLLDDGWEVESVEKSYEGKALGTGLAGKLDLVLKKGLVRAVVDLKWGGERYRRESLVAGAAVQLATYAELLRQDGATDVPVGYFILVTQALLSADKRLASKGMTLPVSHNAEQTWASVEKSWQAAWKKAAAGTLTAPGVSDAAPEQTARDEAGELVVAPPCRYCEYAGLCGRMYGTLEEDADGED